MKLITIYQLYVGMQPEDHVVPHTRNKSFLSFTDISHHAAMSNQQIMVHTVLKVAT